MKYTVVCNESNNGFPEELSNTIVADFRFENVPKRVYRVSFRPKRGVTYEALKHALFTQLEPLLREYPDQQIANEIVELVYRHQSSSAAEPR